MRRWIPFAALIILCASVCELDDEDESCKDAKLHLCENILGQGCSTATMENAVNKVSDACGSSEAASFATAAEEYCNENSSQFDKNSCANE